MLKYTDFIFITLLHVIHLWGLQFVLHCTFVSGLFYTFVPHREVVRFLWLVSCIVLFRFFIFSLLFIFFVQLCLILNLMRVLGAWLSEALTIFLLAGLILQLVFHYGVIEFLNIWVQEFLPSWTLGSSFSYFLLISWSIGPHGITEDPVLHVLGWWIIVLDVCVGDGTKLAVIDLKYLIFV